MNSHVEEGRVEYHELRPEVVEDAASFLENLAREIRERGIVVEKGGRLPDSYSSLLEYDCLGLYDGSIRVELSCGWYCTETSRDGTPAPGKEPLPSKYVCSR